MEEETISFFNFFFCGGNRRSNFKVLCLFPLGCQPFHHRLQEIQSNFAVKMVRMKCFNSPTAIYIPSIYLFLFLLFQEKKTEMDQTISNKYWCCYSVYAAKFKYIFVKVVLHSQMPSWDSTYLSLHLLIPT